MPKRSRSRRQRRLPSSGLPCVAAGALIALTGAARAQRELKEIPSTDPAVELASFKLAPGLEANLFAGEPLIHKPIQMAWDEKGRLWVASSAIYPHIKPGQEQSDKIIILEDTDKDGKADKSTVFFEGLLIPTGILPGDGGAYVANSTELLFMKDTNGDGRADTREVLLSGFGTEDTHHILHGFKRGPDGCLYLIQSVYIHAHIETPFGVRRLMGSGIWQYRPETGRLEVFTMGQVNPWGHIFDQWGQSFTTDGAYGEGINYAFPGATFRCLPDQRPRILKGLNPGQPKQCGLEVISGTHFPAEWQGDLITNDFRGHRVNRFKLSGQGSGYASRQMEDVVRSDHGSFRPIDVKMGPDGALYIADWYNPIIQHGEVDFRDERRDHTNGRIWRVSVKGQPKSVLPDFAQLSFKDLMSRLDDPADWVRTEIRQEFKRRFLAMPVADFDTAMEQAFNQLEREGVFKDIDNLPPDAPASEMLKYLSGAWLLQDLHAIGRGKEGKMVNADAAWGLPSTLLKSRQPSVVAAAVRILASTSLQSGAKYPDTLVPPDMAAGLINHPSGRVRLEMVNGLRNAGTPKAVELACAALDHPMDENLDFSLWLTCSELANVWLPAFQRGELTFGGNIAHISYALKAANKPEAVGALLEMAGSGKIQADRLKDIVTLVGALGRKDDLNKLAAMIAIPAGSSLNPAICEALATAATQRNLRPDGGTEFVSALLTSGDEPAKKAAAKLAGAWKLEAAAKPLLDLAAAGSTAALQALAAIGGEQNKAALLGLLPGAKEPAAKAAVVAAVVTISPNDAAAPAAEVLASLTEAAPASEVYDAFLARKDGPAALAAALKDRKLKPAVASAGVQKAGAVGGDTKGLIEVLTIAGGLQPVMALTTEQLAQMMADVKTQGDPVRGEHIYRRQGLLCQTCHAVGAVGGIVGPDLVSIGASAPVDYLIESLLEPSKKIKEGYATTMVSTKDGGVHSGFLVREDDREVLLRDATGKTESIPAASVAQRENIPVSLMPPALTATLRRDEFVDLVRFMSELGKEGGYKVQEDGTLRRWRSAQPLPEMWRWMNLKGNKGFAEARDELTWTPFYSLVNGTVPVEEATLIKVGNNEWRALESEIDVSAAGKVGLRLNDPAGLQVFVAGQEVPAAAEMQVTAPAGKVRVTLLLDTTVRKTPVKVQVFDLPGSPAKTKAVGGP